MSSSHTVHIDEYTTVTLTRHDGLVAATVSVRVDPFPEHSGDTVEKLAWQAWMAADDILHPSEPERPRPMLRPVCAHCGERFETVTRKARFCSTRCRVAAHRAR